MTSEEEILALRKNALTTISQLADEYQALVEDAKILDKNERSETLLPQDYVLTESYRKLALDRHAMVIDQKVRALLILIRQMKELKVSKNSQSGDRGEFARRCVDEANALYSVVQDSYRQLSELADRGFAVRQAASKLLR